MKDILNEYRVMKIDKALLCQRIGEDLHNANVSHPLCIRTTDVSHAIGLVLRGEKKLDDLIEWVNVIWFTELFYFLDQETDSIISVLEIIETLDEAGACISNAEMRAMQLALNENKEYMLNKEK